MKITKAEALFISGLIIFMLAVVLFLSSCATDRAFVGNALSERNYHEERYERLCVTMVLYPAIPVGCDKMRADLIMLLHHDPVGCDPTKPGCRAVGLIPDAFDGQK